MSKSLSISVVAGHMKEQVGSIQAVVGLRTNKGVISRITPGGTVYIGANSYRNLTQLSITHTEAIKAGYPHAKGCHRFRIRYIKRGEQTIAA